MRRSIVLLAVVAVLLVVSGNAQGAVLYNVTDLGTIYDLETSATGINNNGQVVGRDSHGAISFRTAPNQPINPATDDLGAEALVGCGALDINDSGQVVGYYLDYETSRAFRTGANLSIDPATDDLGTLGGKYSLAQAINNSGQVVGFAATGDGAMHAFRTAANQRINPAADDLGTLGGTSSRAHHINDSGQVVGWAYTVAGDGHAFRTGANVPINPATDDLGTLGGTGSGAYGINASGQVVGWANTIREGPAGPCRHAFRTAPNQPINSATDDLGTLGGLVSVAFGINDGGQVVGWSYATMDYGDQHAFLYAGNGPMQDLNDFIDPASGWILNYAFAINDVGQIVGAGSSPSGQEHAFRLDPIPEPSAFALFCIGAVSLLGCVWRRQTRVIWQQPR